MGRRGATSVFLIMKAFNLRGTNGSGKTHVARALLKLSKGVRDTRFSHPKSKKILAYKGHLLEHPFILLGSYETQCGGCDTIPSVQIVADLLTQLRDDDGLVFYEGLMISHMIGTVGAAVKDWGDDHMMGFLDTPVETCIQRVRDRRLEKGNTKPFDPNKTLVKDYHAVQSAKRNAIAAGFQVVTIAHQVAVDDVLAHLEALLYPSGAAGA